MLNKLVLFIRNRTVSPYCDAYWCVGQNRENIFSYYENAQNIQLLEDHATIEFRIKNAVIKCNFSYGVCDHSSLTWYNNPKTIEYPGGFVTNIYWEIENYYNSYLSRRKDNLKTDAFFDFIQHEKCFGYKKAEIAIGKELRKYNNWFRIVFQCKKHKTAIKISELFDSINWEK